MRTWLVAGAIGLAVAAAGCGGPAAPPVEGTVTFAGGKKAGNLLLTFQAVAGIDGNAGGFATTDDDGKFAVKGDDGRPGLPAGTYRVLVADNNLNADDGRDDGKPATKRPPPNRVPAKYRSADDKLNPLKVTVEKGKTGYDLKLD